MLKASPSIRILTTAIPIVFGLALAIFSRPAASDPLPKHDFTPGVTRTGLADQKICSIKWGKDARHVTAAMKRQVFSEYGLTGNTDPFCQPKGCEIDHLISRELGGKDDVKNLWPQSYSGPWNAHMKDRLENKLHKEVCAGRISLRAAQDGIATDWTILFRHYFPQQ